MTSPVPLFEAYDLGPRELAALDQSGHLVLPGLLTPRMQARLVESLSTIAELQAAHAAESPERRLPGKYAAEHDALLESLIGHPELVGLARKVLGPDIRWDHCVALNRAPGNPGMRWHTHGYSDDDPRLGFLRIFFYVNGFAENDGGLKVVPGSHLFRDAEVEASTDVELGEAWLDGKKHPVTGEPLAIERLSAPAGSVVLMWTHALHGVTPKPACGEHRWTVVYAYRNPGCPSRARWITPEFEARKIPGAAGLMSLY